MEGVRIRLQPDVPRARLDLEFVERAWADIGHEQLPNARAGVNALEGIGMIEAPRGTLIHHYKVNPDGGIIWANLIVATGHNALAIAGSVEEAAKHFVDGGKLQEGMLNRVSAVVRAYDPCLSCSTHAGGLAPVAVELRGPDGALLDEART